MRHLGHQVHDEVVVHHAPGVQLHALQVVRAEVDGELCAADRCREGTRQGGETSENEMENVLFLFFGIGLSDLGSRIGGSSGGSTF